MAACANQFVSLKEGVFEKLERGDDLLYEDINGIIKSIKITKMDKKTLTCNIYDGSKGFRVMIIHKDKKFVIVLLNYNLIYDYVYTQKNNKKL